jgi:hypothetical protein
MSRCIYALMLILFLLAAAIAGNNHADAVASSLCPPEAVTEPGPSPVTAALTPFKEPPLSQELINIFLFEHSPQPCWLSLASNQGSGMTLNPVSPQAKLAAAKIRRTAGRCRYSELHMPLSCSRHLLESSPPGFFLLI